jgi:hypothetical protein
MAFVWPHSHLAAKRLGIRPKTLQASSDGQLNYKT